VFGYDVVDFLALGRGEEPKPRAPEVPPGLEWLRSYFSQLANFDTNGQNAILAVVRALIEAGTGSEG
jgi:hypothetical protein